VYESSELQQGFNISTNDRTHYIQFMTPMKPLHVSAPGCHLQGVSRTKE